MSRPWMPLYVADYLADTSHLNCEEHGAYLLLIMHYWQKGGLPSDDRKLSSIARASLEQWSSMKATIAEFFGDGWTHARIDAELAEAEERYRKRAEAGRSGGKAKAAASSNARAMPQQTPSNALPTTTTTTKEEGKPSSKRARANPDFDAWYQHYPHKVGRGQAERAFSKAIQLAGLEDLIAGVHRYIATKPPDRQWQNPATWLNGKGWLDAPAPAPRAASPPPGRRMNVVEANLSLREMPNEPSPRRHNGDAELLPPDKPGLPAAVADVGKALRWTG